MIDDEFLYYNHGKTIDFSMYSKITRNRFIADSGANTIAMYKVSSARDIIDVLERTNYKFLSVRSEGKVSSDCIRKLDEQTGAIVDNGNPLHIIGITRKGLITAVYKFADCLRTAYPMYLYEGIADAGDVSGAITVFEDQIIIEVCEHCYVRDVTHAGAFMYREVINFGPMRVVDMSNIDKRFKDKLCDIMRELAKIKLINYTAEVSWFNRRLGIHKKNALIWDLGGVAEWYPKRMKIKC